MKRHIYSFIENEWRQTDKSSLRFLNVKTLSVGKVHHSWLSVPNDTKAVKRAYPKIRLLSGTYILQENRARFNQYVVNTCCPLCGTGAEDRVHFLAVCPKLAESRHGFMNKLGSILRTKTSESNIRLVTENPQYLTQVILDISVLAKDGLIEIDNAMLLLLENWSRNVCFKLHQKRSEILGLAIRK